MEGSTRPEANTLYPRTVDVVLHTLPEENNGCLIHKYFDADYRFFFS